MSNQRDAKAQVPVVAQVDQFVATVLPRERIQALRDSLPAHVKPERFERNLVVAVQNHPRLLTCDAQLVFNEVAKAAALGLYLDPTLGEAYLITGWDNKERRLAPQLRIGYRGMIKLARQSGEIATAYAHAVHENDVFDVSMGTELQIVHRPDFKADRGRVVLYYAVVKYRSGEVDFEPMSVADIHAIRDRSDGYKAWKDGKIPTTPWMTDEGEMAKKTVTRRLMKRLPQSPEIGEALAIEDADFKDAVVERPSLRRTLATAHTAPRLGFSKDRVMQTIGGPGEEPMEPILEGEVVPQGVEVHVDAPAPAEPVVREVETAPKAVGLPDPLMVPMADLTADERKAWAEALKAKIITARSADGALAVWKAYFERQIKPLYETDRPLYDDLDSWMEARVKRLRSEQGGGAA